ncbi:MAG: transposase [Nitrospirae bacterium]|nr:transposase [Nitrospirota bacterium]
MRIFWLQKEFYYLWKHAPPSLTPKELDRLRAISLWQETNNTGLVLRTFGMSRATLYRWLKRFDPKDLTSVKEQSRRPKNLRKPAWSYDLITAVKRLRQQYPRWAKDKIAVLLRGEGFETSASTVGRIINHLKKRGELIEPKRRVVSAKRRIQRPYAVRKPNDYTVIEPGDLVQVDTLDIRPVPDTAIKQFTARDMVSRWDVIEARSRATAKTAKDFLDAVEKRMPFPLKAIQVDGGSEFFSEFEEACKQKGIRLFVLPPKSPKLNGHVERSNRTHTEEFYEVYNCSWVVPELNKELLQWEHTYNCIRPHKSLGLKTPLQFLQDHGIIHDYKPLLESHMS